MASSGLLSFTIAEAYVGSNVGEDTGRLDGWLSIDEHPTPGKHVLVECERGRAEDAQEMWQMQRRMAGLSLL